MEPSARLAIVVLVVVAASVANAAGTDSLPHMNSVAHATDDTMLTVECDPTSRGKAECSIVEVTVIQPRTDPREREKAIADFDARKSGLWTYHTTRTVRPNSAPCAEPGKTTTTTYDPLIGEERELRCRYWR
jgi:hypothetical protein